MSDANDKLEEQIDTLRKSDMDHYQRLKEMQDEISTLRNHGTGLIRSIEATLGLKNQHTYVQKDDNYHYELLRLANREIDTLKNAHAALLKSNSEEVDEYNAGHDAGENEEDIDIARMRYREEHPDRPQYDTFDTGYIMGVLGDYDRLKSMQGQIERLSEMSVEQMGTIRELNVQLASTPEEMRENAESAWLAGMSGTHYEKLQEARKEI